MLADAGAPILIASAPDAVMLADALAAAVLALALLAVCSQMLAPPQSLFLQEQIKDHHHHLFLRRYAGR
jgi:hypothetical protein